MTPGDPDRDNAASPPGSEVRTHVTLSVGLVICAAAFWIEVRRALGGNELSWAYVFEWPLLAGFAVYMWWRVLHPAQQRQAKPIAPEFSSMLEAWEEHRRDSAAHGEAPEGDA